MLRFDGVHKDLEIKCSNSIVDLTGLKKVGGTLILQGKQNDIIRVKNPYGNKIRDITLNHVAVWVNAAPKQFIENIGWIDIHIAHIIFDVDYKMSEATIFSYVSQNQ